MERKVTIKVNGKKLVMNKFVRDVTSNIVTGLVEPLHDADPDGVIEITVEPVKRVTAGEESQEDS